jgi:hypothetical protein
MYACVKRRGEQGCIDRKATTLLQVMRIAGIGIFSFCKSIYEGGPKNNRNLFLLFFVLYFY